MTLKFNGHILEMYDSIQELPITRFQSYNLNLLIDGGIGSDLDAFDKHINSIRQLVINDPNAAQTELTNLQQNIRFIMSNTNPNLNSFVVMIRKIDSRDIKDEDLTEDGIKAILNELGKKKLPFISAQRFLNAIKKKLDTEFELFFPKVVDSATTKEFYTKLKQRTMLILQQIQDSTCDFSAQVAEIDEFLMSRLKPKSYHGREGLEVKMIKGFEQTCVLLKQYNVSHEPKKMTTLAFYQALEVIKEQLKKRAKNKK